MKKYNCIVVFNQSKSEILFCKRTKEPYKGQYNFVGGKVEASETSLDAAYRELNEETGIKSSDIVLHRLMDITYYYQDYILELFVGQLQNEIELVEEVNPLIWLPVGEDYADADRFAGEQNIAHIVNIALKYPLQKGITDKDSVCIGVDGCKNGWIAAVYNHGQLLLEKHNNIESIVCKYPVFDEIIMDMVIGLPGKLTHVRPDKAARQLIPGRTSTIFDVPCRQAVYQDVKLAQKEMNEAILGKSLSSQTCAIIPKMREVDQFLNSNPKYKNIIKESHPEVCFARLNGHLVMSRKAEDRGISDRASILKRFLPDINEDFIKSEAKRLKCKADDVTDAICLCITALLCKQGKTETIPNEPMTDDKGLIMRMVIPTRNVLIGGLL